MLKRSLFLILILSLIAMTGCTQVVYVPVTATPEPKQVAPTETSVPQIIYITATPEPVTETATATGTVAPSATPTTGQNVISITSVVDNGQGRATINWSASGSFPSGFQVVWSAVNLSPTFPTDTSSYFSDPNTRSAQITGQPGKFYYVRVCRYINNVCDAYSNVGIVGLYYATATAIYHYPPPYYVPSSTPYYGTAITITKVLNTGYGAARIYWNAYGSFPNGFMIVYSDSSSSPYYGDYPVVAAPGSSTRSLSISGNPGSTYYYRICRYNGDSCDVASAVYSFTFAGPYVTSTPTATRTSTSGTGVINITSISEVSSGLARIFWTASGYFPEGFRIVYSKTTSSPAFGVDSYYVISDGTIRAAYINGDLGYTYYYRICQYVSGSCVNYSGTYSFTYSGATATPTRTATTVPSNTPVPPTNTPVPPTNTPVPPTDTPVPPTDTPVPPTNTPIPPTDTPV